MRYRKNYKGKEQQMPSPLPIYSSSDELAYIHNHNYTDVKKLSGNEKFLNPNLICFLVILILSINATLSIYNIVQMIFMAMSCDIALSFFNLNKDGLIYQSKTPALIVLRSTLITSISLIITMMGPLLLGLITNNIPTLGMIISNNKILNISLGITVLAVDQALRIIIPENNYVQSINSPRISNNRTFSLGNVFIPIDESYKR